MTEDIRFVQRFNNFSKALAQLEKAVRLAKERKLSELEEQGLIKAFEFTHELSWKVLKDFLITEGVQNLFGSNSVTREAFNFGLIKHGDVWMEMMKKRNETVHEYDEEEVKKIVKLIITKYFKELADLKKTFLKLLKEREIRT